MENLESREIQEFHYQSLESHGIFLSVMENHGN